MKHNTTRGDKPASGSEERAPICNRPKTFSTRFICQPNAGKERKNDSAIPRTTPMTPTNTQNQKVETFSLTAVDAIPKPTAAAGSTSSLKAVLPTAKAAPRTRSRNQAPSAALTCRSPVPRLYVTSPPSRGETSNSASDSLDSDSFHSKELLAGTERLRERQLEGIIQKMRCDMEKYKTATEQSAAAWKTMQGELKNTASRYMAEATESRVELHRVRQCLRLKEQECVNLKRSLDSVLSETVKQLVECKTGFSCGKVPQESLGLLEKTIATLVSRQTAPMSDSSSAPYPRCEYDETELADLKSTNAILLEHILELERAIGEVESAKAIRDTDLCWGIKEILSLCKEKEQMREMHAQLKEKYEAYLRRPIQQAKIMKLAQILAYLPKRRRKYVIQQESVVIELREELARLRAEMQRKDEEAKKRYDELLKRYNELWKKWHDLMEENARLRQENAELRRKIEELLGRLRLKEEEIEGLKLELDQAKDTIERLRQQIDKLILELKNRDLQFAEKMKELRQIFDQMREEKDAKQKELMLLKEKCSGLEKRVAELQAKIDKLREELGLASGESEKLREQLEKYLGADSFDGLRALISLANMILARTKRPPQISAKDKQLIHDIFEVNIRGILDEIARLQQDTKVYREELRKQLAQREAFAGMLKGLMSKLNSRPEDVLGKESEISRWIEENAKTDLNLIRLLDEDDPLDESLLPENVLKMCGPETSSTHSEVSKEHKTTVSDTQHLSAESNSVPHIRHYLLGWNANKNCSGPGRDHRS